jgi:hypothetical protein
MGSDFAQFMQQPFVGPVIGLLGFFTVLLVLVIVLLVFLRRRRARQRPANAPAVSSAYGLTSESHDMPDLDTLVNHLPVQENTAPASATPLSMAAPARAARKGTFAVTINDGSTAEAVEVMTVLRDVVEGKLIVQMGDRVYQNINSDAEFKDRFTRLMRELAQVAKPLPATQPENAAAQKPSVPVPPEVPAEPTLIPDTVEPPENPLSDAVQEAAPPAPTAYIPPPPIAPNGAMPGDLPKFNLDDQGPIKPTRAQRREAKPVPEINIAAAIEAYLQHKLRFTPAFDGHSIHIYPSPDGGVSIEVDGQFFDSVGDVTDPDVRSFLQTTIQEWQDRH